MKATCTRKDLLEGVQLAAKVVPAKSAWAIVSHILVRTEGDYLRLSATDPDLMSLQCSVPAKVLVEGSTTVPARYFLEVLATLPEDEVSLESDERNVLTLQCRKSKYQMNGMPGEEFPPIPEVGEEVSFSVSQGLLREMIGQTLFAVSTDETRAILTGINLILTGDTLKLAATDTHRLAVRTSGVKDAKGEISVIVPGRAMNELSRILSGDENEMVFVRAAHNHLLFQVGEITLTSRLIDGQFPSFDRVVPQERERLLTIPTEQLQNAVRRASIVARENSHRIVMKTHGEQIIIKAESGDLGSAYEEVEAVREGDDIEIAFNARYLLDVLNVLNSEGLYLELTTALKQGLIKPTEGSHYLYVIMPMQLT